MRDAVGLELIGQLRCVAIHTEFHIRGPLQRRHAIVPTGQPPPQCGRLRKQYARRPQISRTERQPQSRAKHRIVQMLRGIFHHHQERMKRNDTVRILNRLQ